MFIQLKKKSIEKPYMQAASLLVTSALLVETSALLVVTRSY